MTSAEVGMAKQWYIVHTYSGFEAKVKESLMQRAEDQLTVWHNNQCPHMVQNILATHFRLEEHKVRVIRTGLPCGNGGAQKRPARGGINEPA